VFRIKICGVTTPEDAQLAVRAGADAIGLNFYPGSPRFLSLTLAREIAERVTNRTEKVGVFVNAQSDVIKKTAEAVGLDVIQLHGDEPPSFLQNVDSPFVIKAFRCRDEGLELISEYLSQCRSAGRLPDAVLLDAYAPGKYGGTGKCIDWPAVRDAGKAMGGIPIVLAGGLTPENVGTAIAAARPAAVDTAGGVEASPGVKDPDKVRRFVAAAQTAFQLTADQPE
jgi:phosphoribosylanthranilate isomerase